MQPPIVATPPPRTLPTAQTLRDAVLRVIEQPDGWQNVSRFVAATEYGDAPNLVDRIRNLIMNPETVAFRERELEDFPYLLTIEDYVWRYGSLWGFDEPTIQMARACAERYDQVAMRARYA